MDITELEHESVTDDNRESFSKHMEKFATMEDAALDGMELKKITGKPYRLPKSLDNLPDDNSRTEFRAGAEKLMGITHVKSIEDLADIDPRVGLSNPEHPIDEELMATFKQFVVDKDISKANAQSIIEVHNASIEKALAGNIANNEAMATFTAEELAKHPDFKTPEKVSEQSDLLERAIKNNTGITPEEFAEVGDTIVDTLLHKNPVLARIALKAFAPLAAESSVDGGGAGGGSEDAAADPNEGSKTYQALGWSPKN